MKRGDDLKARTQEFALRVIRLVESLPKGRGVCEVIGRQLLRCATSVGANYRAACRGKSAPDFIAKLGIVEEETDECLYWFELLIRSDLVPEARLAPLQREAENCSPFLSPQ